MSDNIANLLQPMNFNFFGLDLSVKPTLSLSILVLIPILSGLSAFLSSWILQRMQKNQVQGSMKMMIYLMPLMSVYFAFQFPAAIGVYWIFNNIFTCIQEIVMTKIIRKRHLVDEDEPESGKKKKKKGEA